MSNMGEMGDMSDDEELITSDVVLKRLESAWLNEKFAPEILPHQNDMVECMLGQIRHMEANIDRLPKTDIRVAVHKMEISRIKFVIGAYLRTRLLKIEKIGKTSSECLTPAELRYANSLNANTERHLGRVALDKMPGNMQSLDPSKISPHPNMETHVFFKSNETLNGIILEGLNDDQDEEIDLEAGSQHILQYKAIANLLKEGKVQLL